MNRREFITLLGGAAAAWPLAARAQQRERVRRVGMLTNLAADDPLATARVAAFAQAMQGLGWIVGRNLQIGCSPQYCTLTQRTLAYRSIGISSPDCSHRPRGTVLIPTPLS